MTDKTPENIRNRRAQEIQDLQQRYQQAAQDNEQAFDEARQKKFQPITQKVMDAVNAIAKEGNYVYIVDKNASQQAGIVINEALSEDVTKAHRCQARHLCRRFDRCSCRRCCSCCSTCTAQIILRKYPFWN